MGDQRKQVDMLHLFRIRSTELIVAQELSHTGYHLEPTNHNEAPYSSWIFFVLIL